MARHLSTHSSTTPDDAQDQPVRLVGPDDDTIPGKALSRNEVVAVNAERSYYVSDVPSPYLSTKQAHDYLRRTRRRHSILMVTLVTILILAAVGSIAWFIWNSYRPQEALDVPTFDTATIEYGDFVESINTTAVVQPVDESVVTAGISGTVAEAMVTQGSYVDEGDVLFVLDNPTVADTYARVQSAYNTLLTDANSKLAQLNSAISLYNDAVTRLNAARTDAERKALNTAADEANRAVERARSEHDAAELTLSTMQDTLETAEVQYEALTIRAPISGTVDGVADEVTSSAAVVSSTHLCTVSDTSSYRVQVEIPADKRDRIGEDEDVSLVFPSIPDLTLNTSIDHIDDDDLHIASILIENPDERIKKGVTTEVSIIIQRVPDSLMVPNAALITAEDGSHHLDVLLDPTRGIHSDVEVTVVAQDADHAAITAKNIQKGNNVILQ